MQGKHVSPILMLDVIISAHIKIPSKQGRQSQQAPKKGTQGTLTKGEENAEATRRTQRKRTIKDNSC